MRANAEDGFGYGRDPLFLVSLGLYLLNREVIKPNLHTYSPFFHGHFNDCLLVPVALPIYLWVYRRLGLRPDDAPPRLWEIALHVAVWIWFFKWFGPTTLHQGALDWFDAVCYWAGGLLAWQIWQFLPRFARP